MFFAIVLKYFELSLKLYSESYQKLLRTIITSHFLSQESVSRLEMPNFFLLVAAGIDESQGLELESFLESDDDQSSYFADDETSICQSPSTSEFSNEDQCIESKCELSLLLSI